MVKSRTLDPVLENMTRTKKNAEDGTNPWSSIAMDEPKNFNAIISENIEIW
jgi:hypothetical protein